MVKSKTIENTAEITNDVPKNVKTYSADKAKPVQWNTDSGWNHGSIPAAYLRGKWAKMHQWSVISDKTDTANKQFVFEVVNGQNIKTVVVPFDEICNQFGWKSMKFSNNGQSVTPTLLPADQCCWGNLNK